MIARYVSFALAAFVALSASASAQSTRQPQAAPNPGAAEAHPSTVKGPGGYTTAPTAGSQAAPASYGDPANDDVSAPKLGPQQDLGNRINRTVHYVAADYIAPPLVWNAFAGPSKGVNYRSYAGRAGFEVPVGQYDVYVGGDARKYTYPTRAGLVTGIGSQGRAFMPQFTAVDYDADVRGGLKVTGPRLYGVVSYLARGSNTGEPRERGIGYGIEKLPDLDQNFSLHGSVLYYPNVGARYSIDGVGSNAVSYRVVRYLIGASIQPNHSPVFVDAGFLGDRSRVRTDAPVGFNHQGPFVGLGIHF